MSDTFEQREETKGSLNFNLIDQLAKCLESQQCRERQVFLCGPLTHYDASGSDRGWSCGWRNIQMVTSHLLQRSEQLRSALFGGCGFVPDIDSLQRWMEIAWQDGFDVDGAAQMENKVVGTEKWIGTTEACSLFRHFKIDARIAEFIEDASSVRKPHVQHESLLKWVWQYFCTGVRMPHQPYTHVVLTNQPPLYFQHEGHSRTIIGIEARISTSQKQLDVLLLILDPGVPTRLLEEALRTNNGWQAMIKRGVSTLSKPEYQLLYVRDKLLSAEEKEGLKVLAASEKFVGTEQVARDNDNG